MAVYGSGTGMKFGSRKRQPTFMSWITLLIILVCKTYICDGFLMSRVPTRPRHGFSALVSRPSFGTYYLSHVEYDQYETSTADASNTAAELQTDITASTIQSRTLSPNFIINSSILLVAIIAILYQVLTVDIGITRGWSGEEIAARIPLDNWLSYNNVLHLAPLQTKAVTSATVYTIGDILSQNKEGKDMGELDRGRILRSLLAGLIGHGPMSHVWYHVSEEFFDGVLIGHHWWDFIPKVVVDQTIFGPIWNNSYIILLGLMQLQTPSQIWADIKRTTIPLIISGLKLWPFVHCITYGVIPLENRLLWVDAVEIIWVMILANQANSNNRVVDQCVVVDDDDEQENMKR